MKRFLLTMVVALATVAATAQNPSVPARIGNRTGCTLYVKLLMTDLACSTTITATYVIPPFGVVTTAAPPAGWWYDAALIADDITFSGTCYYEKVSVPWALCTGYNISETDVSCCGPVLTSSWGLGGSATSPFLIIHQ